MDIFGSFQGMMGQAQSFFQNPIGVMMSKKMNLPQGMPLNDPNQIIQYLMNSGQLSQDQYNQASRAAKQLESNPQVFNSLRGFMH